MYKITLIILSLAFIGMSVITFYLIKGNKSEYMDANKFQYVSSSGNTAEAIEQAFIIQTLNSNTKLNDKMIRDLSGNEILLSNAIAGNSFLFIRFSELNCNECITYILNKTRRLSVQKGYSDKIVLLATYKEVRNLKILIKDMQLTFPVYLIDGLNIPCEEINYPYCFVSDSSLHANQVFIPDRSESKMTNLYFDLIEMKYFTTKTQNAIN